MNIKTYNNSIIHKILKTRKLGGDIIGKKARINSDGVKCKGGYYGLYCSRSKELL